MDKRTFIKTSSVLVGGVAVTGLTGCSTTGQREPLTNWAGNLQYSTANVHYPTTVDEVAALVKRLESVRPLGSRHSFNAIADSTENQLSLIEMKKVVLLQKEAQMVTVEGGARYGDIVADLHTNGFALGNLASLPHITVAGACATATHGSGVLNGNLATAVAALEFVTADGKVVTLSREKDGDLMNGAVVHLGALGVVTKITLNLLPTFDMKQVVYRNLPMEALKGKFDELQSKGYSVSLFTDWRNKNINEVWIKSKVGENDKQHDPVLFGAKEATENVHPIESQGAESVTDQLGKPGPWYERMPHFKMEFTPSAGEELQSEYFVPIEYAYDAMMAIQELSDQVSPHLFISEIRTIAADDLWMSPCYQKTCVALHTTWKQDMATVNRLLPLFEEKLAPYNPIPHWGKLFAMSPGVLQSKYPKLGAFRELLKQYDPNGKFRNAFINQYIFG